MDFWLVMSFLAGIACGIIGASFNYMMAAEAGE